MSDDTAPKILSFPRQRQDDVASLGVVIQNTAVELSATLVEGHAKVVADSPKAAYSRDEVVRLLCIAARTVRRHKSGTPVAGGPA